MSAAQAVTVSAVPSAPAVTVGQPFQVDIRASGLGATDLGAFSFRLNFDPLVLTYNSYALDMFLGTVPAEALDGSSGLVSPGVVDLAEVSLLSDLSAQPDVFRLATVRFTAGGIGISPLTVSDLLLSDAVGQAIAGVQTTGEPVSVNGGGAVPEPLTLTGVFLGLLATGRYAHRRRHCQTL
jgi:hypothetical protein